LSSLNRFCSVGIEHVAGDGFVTIPKGGDAIFMKVIRFDTSEVLTNC
jgi:hypothetical protein